MVDDNVNNTGNQEPNPPLQVEEVSAEVSSPEVASSQPPPDYPFLDQPPIYEENKSRYLFIGVGVLIFILIFLGIFFLIRGRSSKQKQVTLTYWGLWEEKELISPIIADYQRLHPHIVIDYQLKSVRDQYLEKLLVRSKNGQGPDIFRFHNTWVPALAEIVSPLPSSVMTSQTFGTTFYPVHVMDLTQNNSIVGMPLMIDGLVLIYNQNLFQQAGIVAAPSNWDDLINAAVKLTVKEQGGTLVTSGIALGTANNIEHFPDIFNLFLLQNGGTIQTLNSEAGTAALESYRKFAEDPNNSVWDETMPNSINAFIQERVAMIIAPSWQVLTILSQNKEILIKTAPVPSVPGLKPISIASYWAEGVSKYSSPEKQLESWKFLAYLTEKETQAKLFQLQSERRLFGEPYSRIDMGSNLTSHEYLGSVIQQGNDFVSSPGSSRTFDISYNDAVAQYIQNAVQATIQGSSYVSALETAQSGVQQVLSKYK